MIEMTRTRLTSLQLQNERLQQQQEEIQAQLQQQHKQQQQIMARLAQPDQTNTYSKQEIGSLLEETHS